ncbi:hypothetical protein, partial [Niastella yeongjuensis]|uniref:hypothetical protein n=1 Tax=Niastella yeongjuensis TaxID=354355 RepID=UPI001C432350
ELPSGGALYSVLLCSPVSESPVPELPGKTLLSEVFGLHIRPEVGSFPLKIKRILLYLLQNELYQNIQVSLLVKNSLTILFPDPFPMFLVRFIGCKTTTFS